MPAARIVTAEKLLLGVALVVLALLLSTPIAAMLRGANVPINP